MFCKKICSIFLAFALVLGCIGYADTNVAAQKSKKKGETTSVSQQQPFVELTSEELREDMGTGWNLGNTMDGHTGFTPGETIWQNVKTTKSLIKKVHDLGFNTVRIPVTWGTMIDDDNDYAINEAWISRVQDIVDYCISQDMYVMINIHHDGAEQTGWLRIATKDYDGLAAKFAGVWKNIANYFKDYDEHLIFEAMNEVKGSSMTTQNENGVIMKLNQIFVDTVRNTGSNNAKRWLMVTGKYNFIDSICNEDNQFQLPNDTVENRLILSVHDYTPWSFCGQESNVGIEETTYSVKRLQQLNEAELKLCYDTYTSKGIPVVVGEYGCVNKNNPTERAFYIEGMNRLFQKYKLTGVYWDQGWYDRTQTPDYSFSIVDRQSGEPIEKEVTDALMRGYFGKDSDYTTLEKSPQVVPMTSIGLSTEEVELTINESTKIIAETAPENSNDILLWKTSNPDVATVAYGKINAKGLGNAEITVYSQSGSVQKTIRVTVRAEQSTIPCQEIVIDQTQYQMETGDVFRLAPVVTPQNTTETFYYTSSNEKVVTVSSVGKMVAIGKGTAVVTIHSTGGQETSVQVTVANKVVQKQIRLALNVYYNDNAHKYWSNEIASDIKTVSEDGQYELSFDCSKDLSSAAESAGVSSLNKVTAIYIKDYDVSCGTLEKSLLENCRIRYDKVVVDDKELAVINHDFKSALKDSGIFDTNDPVNAWDGNAIEGVTTSGNAVSFDDMDNPQKITITFTLEGIKFINQNSDDTQEDSSTDDIAPSEGPTASPSTTVAPATATTTPVVTVTPTAQSTKQTDKNNSETVTSQKVCKGNLYYRIYLSGEKAKTAVFVGLKNKKVQKVKIPEKITVGKKKYVVTAVNKKACFKNKYIKTLVLGKKITKIGKEAFAQCSKLQKIVILCNHLKKKNVQKKAFYKVTKKIKIQCTPNKKTYFKKLIKSRR